MDDGGTLSKQGYVKIILRDEDGFTETLWAVRVALDEDHFRLDNSPFHAYRVSADDIVEARLVEDGLYEFVRVVEPSGNRTVRLMFREEKADTAAGRRVLEAVAALGCSFEGLADTTMSITVPSTVSLERVADYPRSTGLTWEYAGPKFEDLFESA